MLFQSTVGVALLAGASFVAAQNSTLDFDPTIVSLTIRSQWCQGQQNTCGTLCSGNVGNNTCDPTTLSFSCTCGANNSAPGLDYYTETLPYFICEENFQICINNSVGDAAAQNLCNTNQKANCGQLDPANFTAAAATTSSASTTASATSAATGSASGTASSSSSKAAGATMAPVANMRNMGTGALAVGLAAMGFML